MTFAFFSTFGTDPRCGARDHFVWYLRWWRYQSIRRRPRLIPPPVGVTPREYRWMRCEEVIPPMRYALPLFAGTASTDILAWLCAR